MIRVELVATPDRVHELKPFLGYVTEKIAGERADSHDTATLAYVVIRNVRDNAAAEIKKQGEEKMAGVFVHVWASNEGARAACRELSMYLGYASDRPNLPTEVVRRLRDQYDREIRRQDSEKWGREREKIAKGRPTVREARRA